MATKVWLKDRWEMLFPLLQALTIEQEDEIKRLCEEEIEAWRARGLAMNGMRGPMTDTRNQIRAWPLTDAVTWLNPRKREKEHIALKYMNFSDEEWAAMNAPSEKKLQERFEDVKFIEDPEAVVAKAAELLQSEYWYEIAAGLAVVIGRRYEELVTTGKLTEKSLYSVKFEGQLKRRDKIQPAYEIPTLVAAPVVLKAWERLRSMEIGSDGRLVSEAAQYHFEKLVPARSGGDLYTHLFRAVYGCLAVFFYAPEEELAIKYLATIYGHYHVLESSGQKQHDYIAALHYSDYAVGNAAIVAAGGQRQGVKLVLPGVEVLEDFRKKDKTVMVARKGKKAMDATVTEGTNVATAKASQTEFSMLKPRQATRKLIDQIIEEERLHSSSVQDEVLRLLIGEHYQLKQLKQLKIDIRALIELLVNAAPDSKEGDIIAYLASMLESKRAFKQSYEKRHAGKDYSAMSLSELRNTKTTEAAQERFSRAISAIFAYNEAATVPEQRWYINPKIITDLVGGKPSLASEYLEGEELKKEIEAHHDQYKLTPGYNRRPVSITARLRVPEKPGGAAFESVES